MTSSFVNSCFLKDGKQDCSHLINVSKKAVEGFCIQISRVFEKT